MATDAVGNIALTQEETDSILELARTGEDQNVRELLLNIAQSKEMMVGDLILAAKDQWGQGIVHIAATNGHIAVVTMVCDDLLPTNPGMRISVLNATDSAGRTAASLAAQKGQFSIIQELILRGANMLSPDQFGYLPLHRAVMARSVACTTSLITMAPNKGGIDAQSASGQTPLHMAIDGGDLMLAGFLIRAGANVNLPTVAGETAVHRSVRQWFEFNDDPNSHAEHEAHFNRLIAAGADLLAPDAQGTTAKELAEALGHWTAENFLYVNGG